MTLPGGWYPDPSGGPGQRYWDGAQWTDHRLGALAPATSDSTTDATTGPTIPRKALVAFAAAVVVLGVVGIWAGTRERKPDHTPQEDLATSSYGEVEVAVPTGTVEPTYSPVGSVVSDGDFAFQVGSLDASPTAGRYEARGIYFIVEVGIRNIGTEAQTFLPQNQKLFDNAGHEFEADFKAAYALNDDVVMELNPGLSAKVLLPFDVPPDARIAGIELHDSAFSRGVVVAIR